jgi:glucokinase
MNKLHIAALDIGGTKIAATVAGESGPLARVTQTTVKSGSPRAVGEQALGLIKAACDQATIAHELITAVGVSSCGPFAPVDGMLGLAAPNLCGRGQNRADLPNDWGVIPLEGILREQFKTVVIENDCVAALIAERSFGAACDEPDCVYTTWSTGIGFGLCVDGRILRGKHGNAGHAGHMLMDMGSDALCGCGNLGDLEGLISGRGISRQAGIAAPDLFAAAKAGQPAARLAVVEAAKWFGRGLYNVAVTLDTRVIVVGGSVWMHHGEWLAPIVREEILTRLPALTAGVLLAPAALGSLVTDIGALCMVMPQSWIERWRSMKPWQHFGLDSSER